jgi:hypothetical protein
MHLAGERCFCVVGRVRCERRRRCRRRERACGRARARCACAPPARARCSWAPTSTRAPAAAPPARCSAPCSRTAGRAGSAPCSGPPTRPTCGWLVASTAPLAGVAALRAHILGTLRDASAFPGVRAPVPRLYKRLAVAARRRRRGGLSIVSPDEFLAAAGPRAVAVGAPRGWLAQRTCADGALCGAEGCGAPRREFGTFSHMHEHCGRCGGCVGSSCLVRRRAAPAPAADAAASGGGGGGGGGDVLRVPRVREERPRDPRARVAAPRRRDRALRGRRASRTTSRSRRSS